MGVHTTPSTGLEPPSGWRADQPLSIIDRSATIVVVTVRFKPAEPPRPPRLEHVRDLWQLHRPRARRRSRSLLGPSATQQLAPQEPRRCANGIG